MFLRKMFFFAYVVVGAAVYLMIAIGYGVPDTVSYLRLANHRADAKQVRIVAIARHWNGSVFGSGTDWDISFTGGPLARGREELVLNDPVAEVLAGPSGLHVGRRVPVVWLSGQWVPRAEAKMTASLGGPLLSPMLLAVFGLILRCVVGPRAFPNRYEPAVADFGPNVSGFPTRRPLAIVTVLLLGFLMMIWQMPFGVSRFLVPGVHVCYWQGAMGWLLFLAAGPVVFWAALPRLRPINNSD